MEVDQHLPREGMLRSRRQLYALGTFAALVLLVMGVFGWLLYRSMAEREAQRLIEDIRGETRRAAVFVEKQVSGDQKLSLTLRVGSGTVWPVLDAILVSHRGVAQLDVLDPAGVVVLSRSQDQRRVQAPSLIGLGDSELDGTGKSGSQESRDAWSQTGERISAAAGSRRATLATAYLLVPIDSAGSTRLGSLLVHLDAAERERVVADVRSAVIGRATSMLAFVLALFGVAAWVVWRNYAASRIKVERVAHTERMAYIGTLAAGLAHEIRSPLNSLSLNMQMLDEEMAKVDHGGSGRRLLEITSAEIQRLGNLVTEFLGYARPRPMELQKQVAVDLVSRVVDVVGGGLEARGLEVRIEDSSDGAQVMVDPDQIHQMLLNLTENAADATERLRRPAWIEYVIEASEEMVRFKIHDNGRGMPEEDIAQATEIFYSRRKGGTGLGLAIVERIVRSHNGQLRIESDLQVGTTVTVELPAA